MRPNCIKFQILHGCIVLNSILKILLHHIDLIYKLRYVFRTYKMIWPVMANLEFGHRSGVFNAFLGFSSEDLGLLGINCAWW